MIHTDSGKTTSLQTTTQIFRRPSRDAKIKISANIVAVGLIKDAQFALVDYDMFLKGRTGCERIIITVPIASSLPSNRNIEIAEQSMAKLDISKCEGFPCNEKSL